MLIISDANSTFNLREVVFAKVLSDIVSAVLAVVIIRI